ncbi:hypothetical protein GGF32_007546 [Allomyces javanicus]|nr:hypothetical protein GGF32_007546 [Allomyces javanicus]
MSTAMHAPAGPSSLLIAASAGVPPCLPTPTSPAPTAQPVADSVPPAQVMYTHHVAAKTVTCHACQKTMPLSRRPRGSPCAQYTIRTHEQTMQHSISIVAMYLHATACSSADRDPKASTARPPAYAPPPNLARYSGNISITAYEGLLFNPQYRLRTLATGAVQVACLVCKLTLPAHYASAEEAVLSVAAHEGHHDHELAVLAASLNVVRHWGRHVRVVESETADPQIMDLVLSDQERAWHSERMVQAAPVPPPAPAPVPVAVAPPSLAHPHPSATQHPHATWPSPTRGAACRDVCCVAPAAPAYHHALPPPQPVSPVTGLMAGVRALSTRGSPQAPTPPSPAPRVLPPHQYHYHVTPAAAAPAAEGCVTRLPPIYAALHVGDGRTPSVPLPRIRIADLLN